MAQSVLVALLYLSASTLGAPVAGGDSPCPDGELPIGPVIGGVCTVGYVPTGDVCCLAPPAPIPDNGCPVGSSPLPNTVAEKGMCPGGSYNFNDICCYVEDPKTPGFCPEGEDYYGPAIGGFCPSANQNYNGSCCSDSNPKSFGQCPDGSQPYGTVVGNGAICPGGLGNFDGYCCPLPACPQGQLHVGNTNDDGVCSYGTTKHGDACCYDEATAYKCADGQYPLAVETPGACTVGFTYSEGVGCCPDSPPSDCESPTQTSLGPAIGGFCPPDSAMNNKGFCCTAAGAK